MALSDGRGRYNHFQSGSIYWHPRTGAFTVDGAIRRKWASLGWERSPLGYPTTDESKIAGGSGRLNHFQYGSIYWFPETGAYAVYTYLRDHVGEAYPEPPRVYPQNYGQVFEVNTGDFKGRRITDYINQRSWVPRGSDPVLMRFTVHGVDNNTRQALRVQLKADKYQRSDKNRGPLLYHGKDFYLAYGTDRDRGYYFAERGNIKGQNLPPGAFFRLERVFR